MNSLITSLKSLFLGAVDKEIKENFEEVEIVLSGSDLNLSSDIILDLKREILKSDSNFRIEFYDDNEDSMCEILVKESSLEDIEDILKEVEEYPNCDKHIIKIKIMKNNINNEIAIYSLEHFSSFLEEATFEVINMKVGNLIKEKHLILNLINEDITLEANKILLKNWSLEKEHIKESYNRKKLLRDLKLNSTCISKLEILPNDFKLLKVSKEKRISRVLMQLSIAISLISFLEQIEIKGNIIRGFLNAYTKMKIKIEIDYKKIIDIEMLSNYIEIFNWIYQDDNSIDKLGIVRNVLSAPLQNNKDILRLNVKEVFESIKSAHNIYQKENVKEYLEVRKNLSNSLLDLSYKSSDVVKSFSQSMRENLGVIISIYIAAFVGNIIVGKGATFQISFDMCLISLIITIASLVYTGHVEKNMELERKRYIELYTRIKDSYRDILTESDINNIFMYDKNHKSDLKYIDNIINKDLIAWRILLIMMAIIFFSLMFLRA
ncbi:MAG: hypothetical protein ACRCWG_17280 [Sarcina sp.]